MADLIIKSVTRMLNVYGLHIFFRFSGLSCSVMCDNCICIKYLLTCLSRFKGVKSSNVSVSVWKREKCKCEMCTALKTKKKNDTCALIRNKKYTLLIYLIKL